MRRRWLAAVVALLILGALVWPHSMNLGAAPAAEHARQGGDAKVGLEALERSGIGSAC